MSTEFWLIFEPQIRPTRFSRNFLFIPATAGRKVRLCVKLFDFFPRWILIRLTWNFSRFVPNSLEILTWNFGKIYFGRIFQIFCRNQGYPLPKPMKFRPTFCNFILCPYSLKKFTQVLSYVVCTQVRRQVHRQITKRKYGDEKPGRFVFGKSVSFTLGLGLTTPYSFRILVWNFYRTIFIVSTEFWVILEPQIRPTGFAINILFITATAGRKVRLCVKLFDFFPRWILICLTWNLSRFVPNSVEILTWSFGKKTI